MSLLSNVDYWQFNLTENDVAISYLPYAHIFEQAFFIMSLFTGMKSGFFSGSPLLLFEDIAALRPTMLLSVPRILNRIYSKVYEEVGKKSKMSQWMFNKGVAAKDHYLMTQCAFNHSFYDSIVFKNVRAKFGGRLRILVTGSAPISVEIMTFYKVALSIHVFEVYG